MEAPSNPFCSKTDLIDIRISSVRLSGVLSVSGMGGASPGE